MIADEHPPTSREGKTAQRKPWFLVEDGKILLFGLEFGGWGSLLALVASVLSLGLTAYDKFIVDPQPEFWAPEQINLACDDRGDGCTGSSNVYLRASGITLINKTNGEHPFTVRSMDALTLPR